MGTRGEGGGVSDPKCNQSAFKKIVAANRFKLIIMF